MNIRKTIASFSELCVWRGGDVCIVVSTSSSESLSLAFFFDSITDISIFSNKDTLLAEVSK